MILDNYMWTYPSFFTREEVEEIHQHAFMVPIEEGTIGNKMTPMQIFQDHPKITKLEVLKLNG